MLLFGSHLLPYVPYVETFAYVKFGTQANLNTHFFLAVLEFLSIRETVPMPFFSSGAEWKGAGQSFNSKAWMLMRYRPQVQTQQSEKYKCHVPDEDGYVFFLGA